MRHTFNLKFFLRFLNRHRLYTAINVFGFSVSLMFVILIAAYVAKELSADRHHVNGDRIYRFEHQDFAYSAYAAGRVLQDRFPEIESYCVVSYENKTLRIGEEYMQVAVDCVDSSCWRPGTASSSTASSPKRSSAKNRRWARCSTSTTGN